MCLSQHRHDARGIGFSCPIHAVRPVVSAQTGGIGESRPASVRKTMRLGMNVAIRLRHRKNRRAGH
jgi:hypothetical protein